MIRDPARLFSTAAKEKAEKKLLALAEHYHCPLFIQTVELDMSEGSSLLKMWKRHQASRQLASLGRQQAADSGVPGLYLFISGNPRAVQVVAWPSMDDLPIPFSTRDCDLLRRQVTRHLAWDGPDNALQTATTTLEELLDEKHPRESFTHTPTFHFGILVLSFTALWLLLTLLSSRIHRRGSPSVLSQAPCFRAAFLAALLGLPGAFWIYDRFFLLPRELLPAGDLPDPLMQALPVSLSEPEAPHEEKEGGGDLL